MHTHTETPSCFQSVWKLNQRHKVLGFTSVPFYVCGLAGKNRLGPAAAKRLTTRPGLHAPACSTTENNIHNSDTLVLKALLRCTEIWSVNIMTPSWQRSEGGEGKKSTAFWMFLMGDVQKKKQQVYTYTDIRLNKIHCLKYAQNTRLTFTPVYARS